MPVRLRQNAWKAIASLSLFSVVVANACSAPDAGSTPGNSSAGTAGANAQGGGVPDSGGSNSPSGASAGGTSALPQAGAANVGGAATAGSGGAATAGATTGGAVTGGATSGGSGFEEGDTPPLRPLNITAAKGEHTHGGAGLDTRATKMLGKLVVDIGVNSGGYVPWLAKRGYHSMGAPCGSCAAPNLDGGRDTVGTCRLGEFKNTEDHVKSTLASLQTQYPEEDWGYFLNADGSVRWSDVAITGMSHGATTAAVAGRVAARMWRVVSRSGPRDTTCGAAGGVCKLPLTTPSYDVACPPAKVASWLDADSKTPMNRFYGIVGTTDVECGDIMFDMHYAKYPGEPVIFNMAGAVLTGTNQFYSTEGGHLDFLNAANKPLNTEAVLNIAFAIPPENQNPAF